MAEELHSAAFGSLAASSLQSPADTESNVAVTSQAGPPVPHAVSAHGLSVPKSPDVRGGRDRQAPLSGHLDRSTP